MPRFRITDTSGSGIAEIVFGALAPSLNDQLRSQEIVFDGDIGQHQRCEEEISHLYCRGLLTKDEVEKARRRLIKTMNLRRRSD